MDLAKPSKGVDVEGENDTKNVGALGTVPKSLEKRMAESEIRRTETIQTTVLLRSARILRRVLETRGLFLSFRLQGITIKAGVKTSQ